MLTILCNHSTIYTNIKSLCCVSETNTMMDANYTSIKKKKTCPANKLITLFTSLSINNFTHSID